MDLELQHRHPWDLSPEEGIRVQNSLRDHVVDAPLPQEIRSVGGVDVSFPRGQDVARAAAVALRYETMEVERQAVAETSLTMPYIPGLLSFREGPAVLEALSGLDGLPDVLLFDGQGRAHPRRFGIASHIGVLLDRPTVGCAKSILVGKHPPLGEERGETAALVDGEEVVGMAVRTRTGVRPVYVSVGHRVDLPTAVALILACGRGLRLPEPTRLADRLAAGKPV